MTSNFLAQSRLSQEVFSLPVWSAVLQICQAEHSQACYRSSAGCYRTSVDCQENLRTWNSIGFLHMHVRLVRTFNYVDALVCMTRLSTWTAIDSSCNTCRTQHLPNKSGAWRAQRLPKHVAWAKSQDTLVSHSAIDVLSCTTPGAWSKLSSDLPIPVVQIQAGVSGHEISSNTNDDSLSRPMAAAAARLHTCRNA